MLPPGYQNTDPSKPNYIAPAAPAAGTAAGNAALPQLDQDFISNQLASERAEIARRGGNPANAPLQNPQTAYNLAMANPNSAVNPQGYNNAQYLINAQFNNTRPEVAAAARANQAGNAAANVLYEFNPATGQMELRKTKYALDPTSAAYNKDAWGQNNELMNAGRAAVAGGAVTGNNLFNREGYQGAVDASGQAAGFVGQQAGAMGGLDKGSSVRQALQLDQYGQDIGMLRASAQGTGPSAAQELAKSQLANNIRAQSAMAAGARGGNVAAAQRAASIAGSNMQMQSANQMSALRAQEQLTAQAQLAAAQGNMAQARAMARGQDLQKGLQNVQGAGIAAQSALGQFGAQQGLTGSMQAQYGLGLGQQQMGLGAFQGGLANQLGLQGLQASVAGAANAADQANVGNAMQYYGIAQGANNSAQGLAAQQAQIEQQQRQQAEAARLAQQSALMAGAFSAIPYVGGLAQSAFTAATAPKPAPTAGPNGLVNPWGNA